MVRHRLSQQRKAAVQAQAFWRMHQQQSRFLLLKETASTLQASVPQSSHSCLPNDCMAVVLVSAALCGPS